MSGLTVYNGSDVQFSSQYPALLVDRTNNYGYKNWQITFTVDPPQPATPTSGTPTTSNYKNLLTIYHGLGYIPAFETVTIGYGLTAPPYGGIGIWNEDALLDWTPMPFNSTTACNQLKIRADTQNLYIELFRQAEYIMSAYMPPSLAGVQLNINTQIFAMGLNDISSQV
jgi:hypothetical protein